MNAKMLVSVRALAAALLLPWAAQAHEYTYLKGGYVDVDRRGSDDGGLFVGGSIGLAPSFAAFGEYTDTGPFEQLSVGGLLHARLQPRLDLFGGASLEHVELRAADDTGLGLRGGLRWWAMPGKLELIPELRYLDVLNDDSTSLRGTALLRVAPRLDAQALLQGGDDDRIGLGLRYNFPTAAARL